MNKRVLILSSEFPPLPGGIGNHAFYLAKYLQILGYSVTVITDFRAPEEDVVFDSQYSFKIYRIKRTSFTYLKRLQKAFSLANDAERIIVSGKFSLWTGAVLKLYFKSKQTIAVLHGSELKAGGKISQKITEWSLKKNDKLIAVSKFTKEFALSINPLLNIEVINNGIELDDTIISNREFNHLQNKINLVTVGNLTFRKGQQNIINALPVLLLNYPEIHYHCIGIPTEIEKFTELAVSLDVLKYVTFHGALPFETKNEILKKSTVFCMLSSNLKNGDVEGFGIAILEANSLGVPTIGSIDSGVADAINDGYSGKLVDPYNPISIKTALIEIYSNYEAYSNQAKEWATHFQWKDIIEKYCQVLEK